MSARPCGFELAGNALGLDDRLGTKLGLAGIDCYRPIVTACPG